MVDEREIRTARLARSVASDASRGNPRVGLVDVGWKVRSGRPTADLAVRFHVRDKPTGDEFERFARVRPDLVVDIDSVPFRTDVIEARYRFDRFAWPVAATTRLAPHRPLVGGVSVGNAWSARYGTLGGIVVDTTTGQAMAMSNWHVLVGSHLARAGLPVYQPAYVDTWYRRHPIGELARHALTVGYDAALAAVSPNVRWKNEQLGLGTLAGARSPMLDARVTKSGRGSGITSGVVEGVDGVFTFRYDGRWRTVVDVCRIVPTDDRTRISRSGDSGSWWLNGYGAVVGLHFAGQAMPPVALAMSMPHVLAALEVAIPSGSV